MAQKQKQKQRKQQRVNPTQRPRPKASEVRKLDARAWISGARLRTLPLAIAPVLLGTAGAIVDGAPGEYHWVRALACLAVALCLQIGVNYANDYSDGIRGTDAYRVGPARLTGSGLVDPKRVRLVAFIFFGLGALAGLFLVITSGHWWLLAVGAAAILAAWFYTGGKRPYGYAGLGEVFVFVFFGLVATAGTTFVQIGSVSTNVWIMAAAVGLFACAVLMVNNIRDIEQDRLAGKRTLAVLLGPVVARWLFGVFTLAPFVLAILFAISYRNAIFTFFALLLAAPAVLIASTARKPKELILALMLTSFATLAYALLLGLGIVFSGYVR